MIAGIDIGEEKHCVQFIDNYGEAKGKTKKVSNDREGFKRIEEMIKGFSGVDHNILFSMEHSGDYWKPLACYLKDKGGEKDEKGLYVDRTSGGNSDNSDFSSNVITSIKQSKRKSKNCGMYE